ncbi:nuclease-related domain-containing protein [Nocardioides nematodiphilus]|uniref:nuclease-related domain-containing protein n=1 Tax=Nocardioides nematodiphilus TaxID=2849669 RepID=UPI001CDA270B|nr:nuclease-related domain-containing protein [Nocardioides nematodiphilus]MCA1981395.1 NERD domain-containing protein [Nocardioides nematodiphilus]
MAGESARESAKRLREKAERQARVAAMFERGAEGEEATAAALAGLPADQWTLFHDLRWPGRKFANVDHIAVGPPGIYVIDSKNWTGSITVVDNVLRQNGRARETAVHGAAEAAMAVSGLARSVSPLQVHPVMCFVRDEPIAGWARDAMLCSTSNLVEMLTSRAPVLSDDLRRMVALELDAALRSATERVSAPTPKRAAPRPRPVAPRAHPQPRRRRGGCVPAFVGLMVSVVAITMGGAIVAQILGNDPSARDMPARADGSCPPDHAVKAWTNAAGVRVYRDVSSSNYAKARADRCFLDAAHAAASGYVRAPR